MIELLIICICLAAIGTLGIAVIIFGYILIDNLTSERETIRDIVSAAGIFFTGVAVFLFIVIGGIRIMIYLLKLAEVSNG